MDALKALLERNAAWARSKVAGDAAYFERMVPGQAPGFFWIGCSDSRVPATMLGGFKPGEVFVHRNVANLVRKDDLNLLSALEFAIDVFGVKDIVVCGHTGCGGVAAACRPELEGAARDWLAPVIALARDRAAELDQLPEGADRADRLAALSVAASVRILSRSEVLQRAWARGEKMRVHGLIYRLGDGMLQDLGLTVTGPTG